MQEIVGSNPTDGKIRVSQFTLFYRVECEKLFCKTNLKLKLLKLIKQNLMQNLDDIELKKFLLIFSTLKILNILNIFHLFSVFVKQFL